MKYGEQPEEEREAEWHDSADADYSWNDGQGEPDGDDWKDPEFDEDLCGPEYWLNKGLEKADDDDEARRRRKRRKRRGGAEEE